MKYNNSIEAIDRKNQVEIRMNEILETGEKEQRELTEDEDKELESLKKEKDELDEEIKNLKENNALEEEKEKEEKSCDSDNKDKKDNRNYEMKNFSLLKAIRSVVNNEQLDERSVELINQAKAEMRKAGQTSVGQIVVPFMETREGEGLAAEISAEDKFDLIAPLRANLVMTQAGATFLTGLVNDVNIPVYDGGNVTWEGEVAPAKNGKGAINDVKLSPKRLTAYIDLSKQFIVQDSIGAEELLRADLIRAISDKLEKTILGADAATSTQPGGLFEGAANMTGTSYADIANLEADLENKNVTSYKFIVNPSIKATLKTTQKGNGVGFVMENGEIDGVPTLVTSNAKGMLLGDFSDYVIGSWGSIDLTIDTISQATNGKVRIVVNAFFDAKPRRASSFVAKKVAKA